MTIYKFPIEITDEQILEIKGYNGLLSIIEQNNQFYVYSFVNKESDITDEVKIRIIGTGHPINGEIVFNWNFLGTIQAKNGLVWHVFFNDHV